MKKNRIFIIVVCIVVSVVILGVFLTYFFCVRDDKLISAVNNGDIEVAMSHFEKYIKDNPKKIEKYQVIFSQQVEDISENFEKEYIEFDIAEKQLKVITSLNIVPNAKTIYEKLAVLNDSRKFYKAGNSYFDDEKYKEALVEYKKMQVVDEYQTQKIELVKEKYRDKANFELQEFLLKGSYDLITELYTEMTSMLDNDNSIFDEFSQEVILCIKNSVNDGNIDAAEKTLQNLRAFIKDDEFYNLTDTIDEMRYKQDKITVMNFLKGKWKRMNSDSELYGMIVQVSDNKSNVGRIIFAPDSSLPFLEGDTKWSNIYVVDNNTVHINDMTKKKYSYKGTLYPATMKLNYKKNTIQITYDVVDGSTNGQIQTWKKVG